MSSRNPSSRTARYGPPLVAVALSLFVLSNVGCGADTGASPRAGDEHDSIEANTVPREDTAAREDGPGAEEAAEAAAAAEEEAATADRGGDGAASNAGAARPIVSCASVQAARDPYQIRSRTVDGDVLRVVVTHGGGCGRHDFRLCYEPQLLETNPVQVNLRLDHDAHGDVCRRIDRKVLEFDLRPLRDHYRATHPNGGTVVLNLGEAITYEL